MSGLSSIPIGISGTPEPIQRDIAACRWELRKGALLARFIMYYAVVMLAILYSGIR